MNVSQHKPYTSDKLRRITREGLVKNVDARIWELRMALKSADERGRTPDNPYIEEKAREVDRVCAELEMRNESDFGKCGKAENK